MDEVDGGITKDVRGEWIRNFFMKHLYKLAFFEKLRHPVFCVDYLKIATEFNYDYTCMACQGPCFESEK